MYTITNICKAQTSFSTSLSIAFQLALQDRNIPAGIMWFDGTTKGECNLCKLIRTKKGAK